MNKTKYNQLREEIIKANEDILELKTGCKCKIVGDFHNINPIRTLLGNDKDGITEDCDIYLLHNKVDNSTGLYYLCDFEIIGRDITPIDILKTLGGDYAIDSQGVLLEIVKFKGGDEWIYKCLDCKIDIDKPLQDQSESTINLLWDLICKK